MAVKLESVEVLNVVIYPKRMKRIGKNGIAVPEGFWKKISNVKEGFERCFYYANGINAVAKDDKLKEHVVDCKNLPVPTGQHLP